MPVTQARQATRQGTTMRIQPACCMQFLAFEVRRQTRAPAARETADKGLASSEDPSHRPIGAPITGRAN